MESKTQSLTQTAAEVLNGFLQSDPEALVKLLEFRVPVNEEISKHPTIQVKEIKTKDHVGVLGLINGILEAAGQDRIACQMDEDVAVGFAPYSKIVKKPVKAP